jgi:hypothetical protein
MREIKRLQKIAGITKERLLPTKEEAQKLLKVFADNDFVMLPHSNWAEGVYNPKNYFEKKASWIAKFGWSSYTLGELVMIAAGRPVVFSPDVNAFYFDDNEFVEGDKTIFVVKPNKTTSKEFYDMLVKKGILK